MIKPGTLYNYDQTFSKVYKRNGRFVTVRKIYQGGSQTGRPLDMWECKELADPQDLRNYDEWQLLEAGSELALQPGQIWGYTTSRPINGDTLTLLTCRSGVYGTFVWGVEHKDGTPDMLTEDFLLSNYARVDGLRVTAARPKSNGSCPLCGRPAFRLAITVECETKTCKNFR